MAPDVSSRRDLFGGVMYYDSSCVLEERHRKILEVGGAVEYVCDGDVIDWQKVTHVFTLATDFPGRQFALKQPTLAIVTVCPRVSR
jgi:hypothetical protein